MLTAQDHDFFSPFILTHRSNQSSPQQHQPDGNDEETGEMTEEDIEESIGTLMMDGN